MRRVGAFSVVGLAIGLAACGGQSSFELPTGTSGTSGREPTVAPSPTPSPTPAPTPAPTTTPNPVVRATIRVQAINCADGPLANPENRRAIPVGCKVLLDLTLKDANNKPTTPQSPPEWTFEGDLDAVKIAEDDYVPILNVVGPGQVAIHAAADGVTSNALDLVFYKP